MFETFRAELSSQLQGNLKMIEKEITDIKTK
jgi:hypothetical protein